MSRVMECAIIVSYDASQAVSVRFAKFRKSGQILEILPAELPGCGTLNQRVGVFPIGKGCAA